MHLCYKAGSLCKEGVELRKLLCDNKAQVKIEAIHVLPLLITAPHTHIYT